MQAPLVYALTYISTIVLLLCWRLSHFLTAKARERIFSTFSKWVVYTLLFSRPNGSSDVTVLSAILIIFLLSGNVIASVLAVQDQDEFSFRLARLSLINMVFLYLGGRTNILVDKIFRFSHTDYCLLHRWLGRIAAAEGIIHGTLEFMHSQSTPSALNLSLLALSSLIALLSVVFIRRMMYELFLQTHLLFSIAMLILVWLHISRLDAYLLSCLTVAASMLLVQKTLWVICTVRRNYGSGPLSRISVIRYPGPGLQKPVIQVRLDIKKSWTVKPGQYVYLTLPGLRSLGLGLFESHPFMIAWAVEDEQARLRTIVLLVQVRSGFTQKLQFANPLSRVIIDGPYGGNEAHAMAKYDKVLLMSSGIGIASHLDTARHLLLAHDRQTARVRRLTILWLLETRDDLQWAKEFLCELHDMDRREILLIYLYYPNEAEGSSEGPIPRLEVPRRRMTSTSGEVDLLWLLKEEWRAEAGNMLVSACGTPRFELRARQAVRRSLYDIDFRASNFQPHETRCGGAVKR
ncbi:hypothetical protein BU25DRAFT_87617 [Macroventuria anomochaeta]|uniref:Uncharacterized protein n=1 Tax=Macroventuria anomochaeta TaxID=301207 RepID=A0ACB6SFL4_9PLEO|nr:uncharacterized protein BU25DRAFT_87617 [Macroventuria anomochaeta]KAF2633016.1 hypothetical protein BU25DRAFT_87617 [Macroventuria anomochaeta]